MALIGLVGSVHSITVNSARTTTRQINMPGLIADLELNTLNLMHTLGIEQTQFDTLSMGREQREINAVSVPVSAVWLRGSAQLDLLYADGLGLPERNEADGDEPAEDSMGIGTGCSCQISLLYSSMVRSDEKRPLAAVL